MARFEAPPDELGPPVLGPVSPKSGSRDAAGPPTRNDRGLDLDLFTFFDVWLRRTVKPTEW
jgi:hypothetical protein